MSLRHQMNLQPGRVFFDLALVVCVLLVVEVLI